MTIQTVVLSRELLNRMLAGRELLKSFCSNLTPQTDALVIARAILLAHDSSELVVSAIAEHAQVVMSNKKAGLMEYIDGIEKKNTSQFPDRSFFDGMNRARVSFKHHGLLPNAQEFHQVLSRAEELLNRACREYLGVLLDELDVSMFIASTEARSLYLEAVGLKDNGNYREALEKIAQALQSAVSETPLEYRVVPGESNPELALELTAYGVDPGAFVRMQEFLPTSSFDGNWKWDTRDKGHPGNWKEDNVSFCLVTFVDLVRKIQYADFQPSAIEFSFLFDDVLTARHDGVLVHSEFQFPGFYGGETSRKFFGELKLGQRLKGKITPGYQFPDSYKWDKTGFDVANIFVVSNPKSDIGIAIPDHRALIVRTEDVEWSYEPNENAKKSFPHLFE